jgi:hypothetical protein
MELRLALFTEDRVLRAGESVSADCKLFLPLILMFEQDTFDPTSFSLLLHLDNDDMDDSFVKVLDVDCVS